MKSLVTLVLICMLVPEAVVGQLSCYTCNPNTSCKSYFPMTCTPGFDYCFSASATMDGKKFTLKGCAKEDICQNSRSIWPSIVIHNVKCCQGNLCNGAESFTQSLLLMIIPLLSSILFY